MMSLYQRIGIVLVLAASLSLTACVAVDVEPEPAAVDETTYVESFLELSEEEQKALESTPEYEPADVEGENLRCDDTCSPQACDACWRGCLTLPPDRVQACLNFCVSCGQPCFC